MIWSKIEQIVGENVPLCIKKILSTCGYDSVLSLKNFSVETVNRIEKCVNENFRHIVREFDCCHGIFYKEQTIFKFLPGHCDLLIALSEAFK